jgi:hypothetical protein
MVFTQLAVSIISKTQDQYPDRHMLDRTVVIVRLPLYTVEGPTDGEKY